MAAILLGGGLALGFATGRRPAVALIAAAVFAMVVGACLVEWADYRSAFLSWSSFLTACVSLLSYFFFVASPAVVGAFVGILVGRSCRASRKRDLA